RPSRRALAGKTYGTTTWSTPANPTQDGRETMTYRKTALSAAIVACLGFSAHVHAQDSAADQAAPQAEARASQADDTTDLDRIVVTGIRGAMEKSLDTKREADSRLEVVTAEDVGKLPAHNVADTL